MLGFLIALFGIDYFAPENQILFAFVVILGAAFPDIDHPKSKIGKKFRPISYLFEHRGFFHSFLAIAGFSFLIYGVTGSVLYTTAFLLGYSSHILADALSTQGIMPFHPLLKFRLKGVFNTGSIYEYILLLCLVGLSVWKLFSM